MVYLIFSQQGFEEAKADIIQNKAELWLNPDILSDHDIRELESQSINYSILEKFADGSRESDVINALNFVEKQTQDKHILVEYI